MEYGHPDAASNGQQQMVHPQVPVRDEEPKTEADLRSVMADEEEHHEKKPMMTRMRDKMRRMKNSMTKKMHGHVDDHDVHDDDEHSVETESEGEPEIQRTPRYESRSTPRGLGGGDKPFTTDRGDEHIDLGTKDSLGGRDDPLSLSSLGENVALSSRDDRPVTLASRDQDVPLGGLGSRDGSPVSLGDREERATLGGLQEPPVTPDTITLDADPVDLPPNDSVSSSDDGNISDPKTGDEQSVSPDVLSSFRDMDISSNVEKKPSYTENLSSTVAGVEEDEEKPSYTEKLTATADAAKDAPLSAASTVYAKGVGGTHSGETHDEFATPGSIGPPGVEVVPREGAGEAKASYTEKLSSTAVATKDAAVSAASTVYAKGTGGAHSSETHDQFATPGSTELGVEVVPREGAGEKGSYTEKLPATAVALKDAAVSAASTVYAKEAGGSHSGEIDNQIATPVSTGHSVEVVPREGAGEEKGSYTVALKDAAVSAASTVYAKVAGGTHSGEPDDQIAIPLSTGPGVEVEPREGAGEKGSYTEKLPAIVVAAKDAAVYAASTVYAKVAVGETNDQIATPGSIRPGVEVEPREGAGEEKGSFTEKLPATVVAAKDAAVSAASTVYAKVAGGTTHDQIATPVSTGPGVEVEPREGSAEKEETYMEMFTGSAWAMKDAAVNAASTVYGKMTWAGTAVQPGGGTENVSVKEYLAEKLRPGEDDKALCEVISESRKKKGVEEDKVGEVEGRIVLPEVTAGEIGVKRVVGTEGGGDGED